MRLRFIALAFFIFLSPYAEATQQIFADGINNSLNTSTTEYSCGYGGPGNCDWTTNEGSVRILMPAAGVLGDLRVGIATAPDNGGGTQTWKFTMRVNLAEPGSPQTCTISEAGTSCNDDTNTSTIAAGDFITIEVTPANTPASNPQTRWSLSFTPTTADETILTGGSISPLSASATAYISISGVSAASTVEFNRSFVAPTAGIFKNLYVWLDKAPSSGDTRTFTFRDDGSTGSVDCVISNTETTCNSTLDSETIAAVAGDVFVVEEVPTSSPDTGRARIAIVFDPTNDGEFIMALSSDDNLHTSNTEYIMIVAGNTSWVATENQVYNMVQTGSSSRDMTIKNMYVVLETDPGATGDIFNFTLRANAGDATATLTATCDGVTTCNASATVTISDADLMTTKVVPTSSPTVGSAIISYTGFIDVSLGGLILRGS